MFQLTVDSVFVSNRGNSYTITKANSRSVYAKSEKTSNKKFNWDGIKGDYISADGERLNALKNLAGK